MLIAISTIVFEANGQVDPKPPFGDTINMLTGGQSNIDSRGTGGESSVDSNVLIYNDTTFVPGYLGHPAFSTYPRNNMAWHFGKRLAQEFGKPVKIVIYAKGGTALNTWLQGGENYDSLQSKYIASGMSSIDIFMWHQGESDDDSFSTPHNTDSTYDAGLNQLVSNIREDFGDNAYFIAGQLIIGGTYDDRNTAITNHKGFRYAVALSSGLVGFDNVHFTGAELVTLGYDRYWTALESILYPPAASKTIVSGFSISN